MEPQWTLAKEVMQYGLSKNTFNVHYNGYLLHSNELPLRHQFEHLDGSTTGRRRFSVPVGMMLTNCEKMPIAKYQTIDCDFSGTNIDDLVQINNT